MTHDNTGRINEHGQSKVKLDLKDKRIISLLSINSRMPLSLIAKKVGLSRDSVNYRIRRLQEKGVILKFIPIIDLVRFGYHTFHVFFLVSEMDKLNQQQLIQDLKKHPNVKSVIEYSDRWDLEAVIIARNVQEFDEISTELVSKYPNLILEKDKLQVIKGYNSIHLPQQFYKDIEHSFDLYMPDSKKGTLWDYDEKDVKILRLLSENARLSTYQMAPEVGLSADSVGYRIKKMLESNVIRRFTILPNLSALNYHWYTFCANMTLIDQKTDAKIKEFVTNHPYILRCVKTLGSWDLMLWIVSDSPKDYHGTVKEIKNYFSSVIKNYDTWLAYKEHYYNGFPEVIK